MRPSAILVLNLLGLLLIWGLIEAPRLVAAILLAIAIALPFVIAVEVRRGRLDGSLTWATALWSAPYGILLAAYLADSGAMACLAAGLIMAAGGQFLRLHLSDDIAKANEYDEK